MRKMKNLFRITMIAFAMLLTVGTAGLAGVAKTSVETAYAANDEGYTYTVSIYSGKEGYFGNDKSKHVIRVTGLTPGQSYTIDLGELDLHIIDAKKYYARGVKVAGHDNDEVSQVTYQSYTFTVTKDESFSVAYGMKGGMVKYKVHYVDKNGKALLTPQEYYGMAGDKPVVSCKYVEGYIPNALNITKTLVSNESKNVFTFTYSKNGGTASEGAEGDANNGGNQTGANTANANGVNGAYTPGDGTNGPAALVDLDNNEPPLADAGGNDLNSDKDGGFSGAVAALIGIIAAGILIALALLYFLVWRKRGEEEE